MNDTTLIGWLLPIGILLLIVTLVLRGLARNECPNAKLLLDALQCINSDEGRDAGHRTSDGDTEGQELRRRYQRPSR
jgi:hypothetical protein